MLLLPLVPGSQLFMAIRCSAIYLNDPLDQRKDRASRRADTLTLALLVARVVANHVNDAAATYELALLTNSLDAGADFHIGNRLSASMGQFQSD